MSNPVGFTVVIVNWNSKDDLVQCLESLDAQSDRDFETIVVDNGSVDGSVDIVRRDFPRVRLIETGSNLGFAEGANRGIALANTAWVATLNNDTTVDRRWIEELRRVAREAGSRVGMLQSCVVFRRDPTRTNSTGVLLGKHGSARDRDFDRPRPEHQREDEVFCPTAGAALYRRAMLEEIRLSTGYFDRTFFMYFEDVDLGWRCRLAGWEARYVPGALVVHAFQGSSRRQKKRFAELHCMKNRVRMLLKNASPSFVVRAIPSTLEHVARAVAWEGTHALQDFARAAIDGLRQRGEVDRHIEVDRGAIESRWAHD